MQQKCLILAAVRCNLEGLVACSDSRSYSSILLPILKSRRNMNSSSARHTTTSYMTPGQTSLSYSAMYTNCWLQRQKDRDPCANQQSVQPAG